jgi:hypothetical protein
MATKDDATLKEVVDTLNAGRKAWLVERGGYLVNITIGRSNGVLFFDGYEDYYFCRGEMFRVELPEEEEDREHEFSCLECGYSFDTPAMQPEVPVCPKCQHDNITDCPDASDILPDQSAKDVHSILNPDKSTPAEGRGTFDWRKGGVAVDTKDSATLEEVREALEDGRGAWLTDGEGHVRALSIAYNGYLVSGSELGLHIGAGDTFQIELPEEEHLSFPSDLSIRCDHNSLKKAYEDFLDKPEDDTILDVPIPPLAIGEDVVAGGLRKAAERLKGMSDKEVDQALAEANPDTPGDGWEFCEREDAEEYRTRNTDHQENEWGRWWTTGCRYDLLPKECEMVAVQYRRSVNTSTGHVKDSAKCEHEEWEEWPSLWVEGETHGTILFDSGQGGVSWQWCVAQRDRFDCFVFEGGVERELPWRRFRKNYSGSTEYAIACRMKREG